MLHASLDYAQGLALVGLVPVLLGLPVYFIARRGARPSAGVGGSRR